MNTVKKCFRQVLLSTAIFTFLLGATTVGALNKVHASSGNLEWRCHEGSSCFGNGWGGTSGICAYDVHGWCGCMFNDGWGGFEPLAFECIS